MWDETMLEIAGRESAGIISPHLFRETVWP